MKSFRYKFKNTGELNNNDVVYEKLFELTNHSYTFSLIPNTKFWRFGIRFSKTETIEFYHPEHRYKSPDFWDNYIDIHLGVGEWNNVNWYLPNRFHFVEYNLNEKGNKELNNQDTYIEKGAVTWKIEMSQDQKHLLTSYIAAGCLPFEKKLELPNEYKYFQVFAWADKIEFEIVCIIKIQELGKQKVSSKKLTPAKLKKKPFVETDSKVCISDDLKPAIEVKELAQEVAELLKLLRDPTGNMFGIFGKWGRGKTFLWKQIWQDLKNENQADDTQFKKVEFHAWKYQDTPALWAYLYETLADKYFEENKLIIHKAHRQEKLKSKKVNLISFNSFTNKIIELALWIKDTVSKFLKRVKLNTVRKGYKPFASFMIGLLLFVTWLFLIPFLTKVQLLVSFISAIGIATLVKMLYFYFIYKPKAINILSTYSEKVSFQKYLGLQAEIQKEIIFLLESWISKKDSSKKKVLLFVDDIDRCNETKIIQVVDSLKVMLENAEIAKRMTILVAIDERVLKMAINVKYHDLITKSSIQLSENSQTLDKISKPYLDKLTKEYIDKLFISGIKLGELSLNEKYKILDSITENKILEIEPENIDDTKAVISSSTSVTTATTISPNDQIPNQEEDEKLIEGKEITKSEYDLLKSTLESLTEATPRTIRIYYYRYLFAKKIMKYKFKTRSVLNKKWDDLNRKKWILPLLIIYYSIANDSKEMDVELESLEKQNDNKIKKVLLGRSIDIDKNLYKELLRIVEMVVPY